MRSLRLKLILGSLFVLGTVIVSFGLFVYFAKSRALLSVMDGRLVADAQAITSHVEFDDGRLLFVPAEEYDIRRVLPPAYRIVGPGDGLIDRSAAEFSPGWPTEHPNDGPPRLSTVGLAREGRWRIVTLSSTITDEQDDAQGESPRASLTALVTVQCAEPLGPVRRELRPRSRATAVRWSSWLASSGTFPSNRRANENSL